MKHNVLKSAALAMAFAIAGTGVVGTVQAQAPSLKPLHEIKAPTPDPRVGLKAGLFDAGEAIWNLKLVSTTPPP
jgi:hypothetical protein